MPDHFDLSGDDNTVHHTQAVPSSGGGSALAAHPSGLAFDSSILSATAGAPATTTASTTTEKGPPSVGLVVGLALAGALVVGLLVFRKKKKG